MTGREINAASNAIDNLIAQSFTVKEEVKYFALYNEELGYITECPTYEDRTAAERSAMGKCRRHSVVEVSEIKPCNPCAISSACLRCARCSATVEKRLNAMKR